jgi:hypothetical protein
MLYVDRYPGRAIPMAANPREPRAVKRLIADATARLDGKKAAAPPPINAVHHTESSLWAKIRRRRGGR